MKVSIVVEFDVKLETDGEELDYDQLRYEASECLRTHVENMMSNEHDLDALIDDISDCTDFLVNNLAYEIKQG